MKTIKCTDCKKSIPIENFITNKELVGEYGEGCNYFGHTIKLSTLKKLIMEKKQ